MLNAVLYGCLKCHHFFGKVGRTASEEVVLQLTERTFNVYR